MHVREVCKLAVGMCVCMGMYGRMDLWMYACMNTDVETAKTLCNMDAYACMDVGR